MPHGAPRTFTEKQRDEALRSVEAVGIRQTERQLGISHSTLQSWIRRYGITPFTTEKRRAQTEAGRLQAAANTALRREELRTKLIEKAHDLLERMDKPHVDFKGKEAELVTYPIAPSDAVRNYAVAFAVLIDKFRLEVGEATDRTESVNLTDGLSNDVKRELRERLARSVRGESEPDGTPGDAQRAGARVDS